MKFRWYITKTHLAALIGVLVACIILLALTGCSDERGSNQEGGGHITAGATLVSIGLWFTWAGSFALGIGILGSVAATVMPAVAGFRGLLADIAVIGLSSLLLGTSFIWLGNHAWLLATVVILLFVGIGVRYRTRITRFLGFPHKPSPVKADHG